MRAPLCVHGNERRTFSESLRRSPPRFKRSRCKCNFMQFHAISRNSVQFHAISCCNSTQVTDRIQLFLIGLVLRASRAWLSQIGCHVGRKSLSLSDFVRPEDHIERNARGPNCARTCAGPRPFADRVHWIGEKKVSHEPTVRSDGVTNALS